MTSHHFTSNLLCSHQLRTGSWHPKASETTGRPFRCPVTRHANEAENDGRRWQPGGPDVRSLLQAAGLLPPKPTERCGKTMESMCWRTVVDIMINKATQNF